MSRVSYFQRFSQRENHATNNTLLIFRHFYQASPLKFQGVLTSLLDAEVSIGLAFEQQIRGDRSVPDALIIQEPLRIFIETKRGKDFNADQITRHIETIVRRYPEAGQRILLGITQEPVSQARGLELQREAAGKGVVFAAVTFSQIVDALRAQCAAFERDLVESVADYEQYLAQERLLEIRSQQIAVFPCGVSFAENEKFGLYYEPPSRRLKNNAFIGIYKQKRVALIGEVEAVAVFLWQDGSAALQATEMGQVTDEHVRRVRNVIEATSYYDLKAQPMRFYLAERLIPTELQKISPGGLMGMRYIELSEVSGQNFDPRRTYTAADLAELVRGRTFQ